MRGFLCGGRRVQGLVFLGSLGTETDVRQSELGSVRADTAEQGVGAKGHPDSPWEHSRTWGRLPGPLPPKFTGTYRQFPARDASFVCQAATKAVRAYNHSYK